MGSLRLRMHDNRNLFTRVLLLDLLNINIHFYHCMGTQELGFFIPLQDNSQRGTQSLIHTPILAPKLGNKNKNKNNKEILLGASGVLIVALTSHATLSR